MKNLLTALFDYRVKRFTILFAIFIFILDFILQYIDNQSINTFEHHIMFHYLIILSLMGAVGSKDKIDDELSKEVRYGILKTTFSVAIVMFGILALILSGQSITTLSTLTIMYCLEGIMVVHLILYYFGVKYHPKWLLNEKTAPKRINTMMIGMLIGLFILFLLVMALNFLDC